MTRRLRDRQRVPVLSPSQRSRHGSSSAGTCGPRASVSRRAFIAGAVTGGAQVTDLGLASTDLLYFASGSRTRRGAMLTASHNPAQYNGMKFCLAGARPVGEESGLFTVRDWAVAAFPMRRRRSPRWWWSERDLLEEFADHVRSFIDLAALHPLRSSPTPPTGWAGSSPPRLRRAAVRPRAALRRSRRDLPEPPGRPDPAREPRDLCARDLERDADVGLAFDGDADRVFLVDELGVPLSGSTTTAIVAKAMLEKHPGATVLYNCICSQDRSRGDRRERRHRGAHAGRPLVHQAVMAETGAVFGGEHSGHYYFKDNYRADSGIIAALIVLEVLVASRARPFRAASSLRALRASGEINSAVADPRACSRRWRRTMPTPVRDRPARRPDRRVPRAGGSTCVLRTPSRCCA